MGVVDLVFWGYVTLKAQARHIEALKKFDEAQTMVKESDVLGEDCIRKVYNEIAIVCNILSMEHL